MTTTSRSKLTPADEVALIRKKLQHFTLERESVDWLDTGSPLLNAVLGSEELGIPYGKMIELFGLESSGKTLLMQLIIALAQSDGARAALADLEFSHDEDWATRMGIDCGNLALFQPQVGHIGKGDANELITSEYLLEEVQEWMAVQRDNGVTKLVIGVDSTTAILTKEEEAAGLSDANMRSRVAQAEFMSRLMRRWVPIAISCNAIIIYVNQLRESPGAFGNPEYTPGGKAAKYYCAARLRVSRAPGGGNIMQTGKIVGITGLMKNVKNKMGGRSLEKCNCGFKCNFSTGTWDFLPSAEVVPPRTAAK